MRRCLTLALAAAVAAAWAPSPAEAAITLETLRTYVTRAGARVDSAKGNLLVTSMVPPAGRGRVEIRMVNEPRKNRLGMYAFGFANLASASERTTVYEYLLRANSELGVGSFFVDKDHDVGFKVLIDTRAPLSFESFQIAYLAMANAIAEHRPEIVRLAGPGGTREKPADEPPAEGEEGGEGAGDASRPAERPRRVVDSGRVA